jgi:hypothetical protein
MAFWNKDIPQLPISKTDDYKVVLQERGVYGFGKPVFVGQSLTLLTEPGSIDRFSCYGHRFF